VIVAVSIAVIAGCYDSRVSSAKPDAPKAAKPSTEPESPSVETEVFDCREAKTGADCLAHDECRASLTAVGGLGPQGCWNASEPPPTLPPIDAILKHRLD